MKLKTTIKQLEKLVKEIKLNQWDECVKLKKKLIHNPNKTELINLVKCKEGYKLK